MEFPLIGFFCGNFNQGPQNLTAEASPREFFHFIYRSISSNVPIYLRFTLKPVRTGLSTLFGGSHHRGMHAAAPRVPGPAQVLPSTPSVRLCHDERSLRAPSKEMAQYGRCTVALDHVFPRPNLACSIYPCFERALTGQGAQPQAHH